MNNTDTQLRNSVIDLVKRIESGEMFDAEEREEREEYGEESSVYDWISNQLSIECVMRDTSGNWLGCEILVTCGGPNIRVNTRWDYVTGYWGNDHVDIHYEDAAGLDEACQEMFG